MFLNKKSQLFLVLIILTICIPVLFIPLNHKNTESLQQPIIKNEVSPVTIKAAFGSKTNFTKNDNLAPKIQNALEYIKQHNRNPSAQTLLTPGTLIQNVLLKSTSWKIWPQTQVIRTDEKTSADKILARVSNLLIIDAPNEIKSLTEFNSAKPIAVYDERLKKAGVITGTIKIQTDQKSLLENELYQYRAHITESFEAIHIYFVTSTDLIFNLEHLFQALKSNPYVKEIELEILSKNYEKN